jgi:benzoylformate decarboxylase
MAPAKSGVLERHDLLLSIGGDLFTMSLPSPVDPMPPGLAVIHLDLDPWEIGKNYAAKIGLLGDPKTSLPELAALLGERMTAAERARAAQRGADTRREIAAAREQLEAKARAEAAKTPIRPLAFWQALRGALPAQTVVVEEAVSSAPGLRQLLRSDDPQSFFGLRGGGIGWGLPAAIGVKLALPERPVVALIGDGSAMYTCQALWTAAHDKVDVVVVILNNRSYRILKQRANAMRGFAAQTDRYVGMDLTDPAIDYVGLARALGVAAERARALDHAVELVGAALRAGGPHLVEVELDRTYTPL